MSWTGLYHLDLVLVAIVAVHYIVLVIVRGPGRK